MSMKELIIGPLVTMINEKLGSRYGIDDFYITPVQDNLTWKKGISGKHSGEKRCIYDLVTKNPNGIILRTTIRPDRTMAVERMSLDQYQDVNQEGITVDPDDNRTTYSCTYRIIAKEVGMSFDTGRCPNLGILYLEGCDVLATESGHLIQTNLTPYSPYLLHEQSDCSK